MSNTEATLKRLIRICPEIVLEKRELELIIDGKINQVISEHKNEDKVLDQTEEIRLDEDITEAPEETPTTDNEEEHGEYCGCSDCTPEN